MVHGVTTQWEDTQVKMGNWKAVEKDPTSEQVFQDTIDKLEVYDNKYSMTEKQLEEKAEEDIDFDEDDEFMKMYRQQRMGEMKEQAAKPRFGSVLEITKPEWDTEILRAPTDVFVVINLYQD